MRKRNQEKQRTRKYKLNFSKEKKTKIERRCGKEDDDDDDDKSPASYQISIPELIIMTKINP